MIVSNRRLGLQNESVDHRRDAPDHDGLGTAPFVLVDMTLSSDSRQMAGQPIVRYAGTGGFPMRRISIPTLMAFILVSAVYLAALRNASELWAGFLLLLAFAAVGVAVLGAIILWGEERYRCLGFALFSGGGYFATRSQFFAASAQHDAPVGLHATCESHKF